MCTIGIDIASQELVIAVRPSGKQWTSTTDESALDALTERLIALSPTLIVAEATGGLERPLIARALAAGLPLVIVNPRQVREHARSRDQLAKTDRLDAMILARFGDRAPAGGLSARTDPYEPPSSHSPGRTRALRLRLRHDARSACHMGRSRAGPKDALHGPYRVVRRTPTDRLALLVSSCLRGDVALPLPARPPAVRSPEPPIP